MNKGILVGRFQPFHIGHQEAVKYALERVDQLVIVVGSSQKSHEPRNPFTAKERITMIRNALEEAGIGNQRFIVTSVPDATSHSIWISDLQILVPNFEVVFSNDPLTIRLFRNKGVRTDEVTLYKRDEYSATEVRRRLIMKEKWENLVPSSVAKLIKEVDGVERLRSIQKSNQD